MHSRKVGFILPQTPMVEDGQEREQAVKLYGGRNLSHQEHVSVFWLVLAQWRCQGSGYPLPQAALLHAAGTEGCTVCLHCRDCTRPQRVVLACSGHHIKPGKDLLLSSALMSLVRELWRQSPSNCISLCLGFGQKICLTVTAVNSSWLCYTLHLCQKK